MGQRRDHTAAGPMEQSAEGRTSVGERDGRCASRLLPPRGGTADTASGSGRQEEAVPGRTLPLRSQIRTSATGAFWGRCGKAVREPLQLTHQLGGRRTRPRPRRNGTLSPQVRQGRDRRLARAPGTGADHGKDGRRPQKRPRTVATETRPARACCIPPLSAPPSHHSTRSRGAVCPPEEAPGAAR